MKKLVIIIFFDLICLIVIQAQTTIKTSDVNSWTITGGVHVFTKQIVRPNYEPIRGLSIYSKPTTDYSLEVTRLFNLKGKLSSSLGLRLGNIPYNQGLNIAENITRDGLAYDTNYKNRLPYIALKGLINISIWGKKRLTIMQQLGSAFVLVPHAFANYDIASLSSGSIVPYYISKGVYNPNRLPFFSALSETSLIYTKGGEKKWLLSVSFEVAPKTVIESNYIFYSKTEELKGTITRRYQQLGVHFGWFWTTKKKRNKSAIE